VNVLVEQHLSAGRLDQAESIARHALGKNPNDVEAEVTLARVDAERGFIGRAKKHLEELRKKFPAEASPMAFLAHYEAEDGHTDRARALAFQCSAMGGQVPVADVILGDNALEDGNLEEALELFHRALHNNQECAGAWYGRGRVMLAHDELAEAEDALANAVQFGPKMIDAWIDLVVLERDAGAFDAAEDNLAMALKLHPGHDRLVPLKATLEAIRDQDPLNGVVNEVREAVREGDIDVASKRVSFLEAQHYDDPRTLLARAEFALAIDGGDILPVIHDLNRFVREEPARWEHKCALGRLLIRTSPLQNPRMAVAHCEEAWQISGEHPRAGIGLVEAWAGSGKPVFARALCKKLADGEGWEAEFAASLLEDDDLNA